ncbi:MAG: YmL10 [Claussenomyces sp. TS43310]|nr:MAG: YmL10 [Claussenomyces sp. TS43310]
METIPPEVLVTMKNIPWSVAIMLLKIPSGKWARGSLDAPGKLGVNVTIIDDSCISNHTNASFPARDVPKLDYRVDKVQRHNKINTIRMPPRLPGLAAQIRVLSDSDMAPRIASMLATPRPSPNLITSLSTFLVPFLQTRNASILADLRDNAGAYNRRKRKGRGPSSGMGKTSGRGHKGQKQHGKVPARFQGGQTPDDVVHHQRGDENRSQTFSVEMSPINLDRIQSWIDQGRLDATKPITIKELAESRCLHGVKDGVKLLARGKDDLKTPINILVSRASTTAIEAIEAVGGKVTTRFYTRQSVKRLLKGETGNSFTPLAMSTPIAGDSPILAAARPFAYRLPDPTSRKDLEYYRDPAHRGYLSHLVEEGHGPSLYFRTPGKGIVRKGQKASASKAENKLW